MIQVHSKLSVKIKKKKKKKKKKKNPILIGNIENPIHIYTIKSPS